MIKSYKMSQLNHQLKCQIYSINYLELSCYKSKSSKYLLMCAIFISNILDNIILLGRGRCVRMQPDSTRNRVFHSKDT